jgi:hypothetical protein
MLTQQTGLVAERTFPSISGTRPTAACGEMPGSIDVRAPGSAEASSTALPPTACVDVPDGTAAGAVARAVAWSGGSGVGVP